MGPDLGSRLGKVLEKEQRKGGGDVILPGPFKVAGSWSSVSLSDLAKVAQLGRSDSQIQAGFKTSALFQAEGLGSSWTPGICIYMAQHETDLKRNVSLQKAPLRTNSEELSDLPRVQSNLFLINKMS